MSAAPTTMAVPGEARGAEGEELGMSIANPFFGVTDRDARSARITGFGRVRRIPVLTSMQKFRPDGVERGSKPRAPSQGLFALESVLNVSSTFRPTGVDTTHEKLSVTLLRKIRIVRPRQLPTGPRGFAAMVGSSFDAHAPLEGFKLRGKDKLAFVSDMFDRVAPTYDLLNHFISLGNTTIWRLLALTRLAGRTGVLKPGSKILDVGCGTGWVTWFFGWYYRGMALDVEGMDCSKVMLDEARKVNPGAKFTLGDVCDLQYETDSFDVVTTVYTLRNFPDLDKGVGEMYRVTKPGGFVVVLDAFPPGNAWVLWVLELWLERVMPRIAAVFMNDPKAYRYLSASIRSTVAVGRVGEMLEELGAEVEVREYTFRTAARIVARKPSLSE